MRWAIFKMKIQEMLNLETFFTKKNIIFYLYQKLITKKERKATSILSKNLKLKTSNCINSIRNYEFISNFSYFTKKFWKFFELTNQRRGRENSKFKNGPTLDQISPRLGPHIQNLTSVFSSICPRDYYLSEIGKSEVVSKGLNITMQVAAIFHSYG